MCACVFSSHSFWTSTSLDVPAGVTQEAGHTVFFIHLPSAVRALIFLARRIQPFLFLVDREVEFIILYNNSAIDPYKIKASSLEHKNRYKFVIGENKCIYVSQQVRRYFPLRV